MKWEKLGLIFNADRHFEWMRTHASLPMAQKLNGDLFRIYYSTRDSNNRSNGAYIDIDIFYPEKILNISVNLVALISACVFFKAGYDATLLFFNLGQLLEIEIDVPIWWMYLAFPVGFFILGLVAIELLIENIKDLLKLN